MKKKLKPGRILLILFALLAVVYSLGPSPDAPVYELAMPEVPESASALESYIHAQESQHKLRPDNEARIIWADSLRQPSEYAIVYLHGFSASQGEGYPVHQHIAQRFGCNLYLSRLSQHGIDTTEQLLYLTADNYWESAKQALAIGKQLGRKVILMGTSTGGTQALQLAAAYPQDIAGLVLMSPNLAINNSLAWLANNPWGLQIGRLAQKGQYVVPKDNRPEYKKYWNYPYRLEAVVQLQEMLETSMHEETYRKVSQPVMMMYYYKDEVQQDSIVKVSAMLEMFDNLGTPATLKRKLAIPNAGHHVLASPIKSKDVATVEAATAAFLQEIMGLRPN
jgi:pimeloyl-ACP methyl ester carboxylesterase